MGWFASELTAKRWLGLAILSGVILGGYAGYDLATEKTRAVSTLIDNTARSSGVGADRAAAVIQKQVAHGIVRVMFTAGIYLALFAAALAIAGGLVTLVAGRKDRAPDAGPAGRNVEPGHPWGPERLARPPEPGAE